MNRDLFLAILSMDSYHRGYHVGLNDVDGQQVGDATLAGSRGGKDDDEASTAQAVGFFAQAYSWNGETVIAHRGTDSEEER